MSGRHGGISGLVGQDGILRPIVNRPVWNEAKAREGRLTIGRRIPSCPTRSPRSLRFLVHLPDFSFRPWVYRRLFDSDTSTIRL